MTGAIGCGEPGSPPADQAARPGVARKTPYSQRGRRLSRDIVRGGPGPRPKPTKVRAGTTIMTEGEAADSIVLVLDGLVQVEVGGTALATRHHREGPASR